jgi:hypothetical protein|tara:strand:+ start:27434 stop:27631 length:198 start_codon:yes stop_codon:yes gene_type:complete
MTAWRSVEWTHLFPTAKQATPHVAHETTIPCPSLRIVVLAVREVVIAAVVRHGDKGAQCLAVPER